MQKIFIVEDDEQIVTLLDKALSSWNFEIESVGDFQQVAKEVLASNPDLVLMDITLPFYNGFHWTNEIRKLSTVPIVFISSAGDNMNMVLAMNMGADDFVTKPFDIAVLTAKIQALLRRTYVFKKETSTYEFLDFQLDIEDTVLKKGSEQVELSRNEVKILSLLFQNVGQLVTKEEIMEKLWEDEHFIDKNTLSVTMTRLRKKLLELDFAKYIQTIKGKGFSLGE
ncbi:DNA-binding response regulator, OmpR family, contains REC and winged-helix (wHTH) domain [Pilibacter termitis]|uniref:DNA-binding response regulator, OmpR family, contains REC and winged-helix (WHTH) domain n=1 Tax=Pilibacter termitis TaxID=263852 RepID=A0A1T4K2J8_9ENTE|nr:response regulator transcription factor [Pilibacter termitis]SJZ36628.1 DNA-binding response regulator, OmpR family, contains REC and winged-helix (wHTH) domain [Pilibacter termitis]